MTPTAMTPSQVATVDFVEDRCDGCGAAARLTFTLATGGDLALCGHHANRMADRISATALWITVEEGFDWSGSSPNV